MDGVWILVIVAVIIIAIFINQNSGPAVGGSFSPPPPAPPAPPRKARRESDLRPPLPEADIPRPTSFQEIFEPELNRPLNTELIASIIDEINLAMANSTRRQHKRQEGIRDIYTFSGDGLLALKDQAYLKRVLKAAGWEEVFIGTNDQPYREKDTWLITLYAPERKIPA